jgi:hypothetical protein
MNVSSTQYIQTNSSALNNQLYTSDTFQNNNFSNISKSNTMWIQPNPTILGNKTVPITTITTSSTTTKSTTTTISTTTTSSTTTTRSTTTTISSTTTSTTTVSTATTTTASTTATVPSTNSENILHSNNLQAVGIQRSYFTVNADLKFGHFCQRI